MFAPLCQALPQVSGTKTHTSPAIPGAWNHIWGACASFLTTIISFILTFNDNPELGLFIVFCGIPLWIFVAYSTRSLEIPEVKFENVIIETRGGSKISYSVDVGQGHKDMEIIEEARIKK